MAKNILKEATENQAPAKLCLSEMPVIDGVDGSWMCGYCIVEVWPSNFQESCRYLHGFDWGSDIAPLVLSHFPLSYEEVKMLPKRVSWLQAKPNVCAQLQALHTALVKPLERRGLPCVDFAEFVVILANGGEASLVQASGQTASLACDALFVDEKLHEWISAKNVAMCLNIRTKPFLTMSEFELIGHRLESFIADESFAIMSANIWDGNGDAVEMTLLAVLDRN